MGRMERTDEKAISMLPHTTAKGVQLGGAALSPCRNAATGDRGDETHCARSSNIGFRPSAGALRFVVKWFAQQHR